MGFGTDSEVDDVPTWSLWLDAAVGFGPVTLMWLLGVLALPLFVLLVLPFVSVAWVLSMTWRALIAARRPKT